MDARPIALITDHSSTEGSRAVLVRAVEMLTGRPPVQIDARHFITGGHGRVTSSVSGEVCLEVPSEGIALTPSIVLVYEIAPHDRRAFEPFQRQLRHHGAISLGTEADAWRVATEKNLTVERFVLDGVPHMRTSSLSSPTHQFAADAFEHLGGDVWARPSVGMGGNDVFHVTTLDHLRDAADYYAKAELDWLISRDARNVNPDGLRHQYRVVVLGDRVVRVCEHVQENPDAPCNEGQGAVSTLLDVDTVSPELCALAVRATRSLGLSFAGVDLAVENGGVVFEVNVHPMFGSDGGLETVAIPYVEAHLAMLRAEVTVAN